MTSVCANQVLLDNFISETARSKLEQYESEFEEMRHKEGMRNVLDPVRWGWGWGGGWQEEDIRIVLMIIEKKNNSDHNYDKKHNSKAKSQLH